ncbi:MAG: cytochrome c biogenesis heme-transporting ATPase CcmA [Rhodocyclaceae bacterium]|nr:cytochrome c biogenesis heme-transporting ATPase CcmA [Rhodocyclaceae bacterium]
MPAPPKPPDLLLQVRQLCVRRGERRLFADLSFALEPGRALFVRGANGCGKTTLLRTVCGLARAESGEICWRGADIHKNREAYARELAYVGHPPALKEELSAIENLALALALSGRPADDAACFKALDEVGLGDRVDLPARSLSQGQRRRVHMARLLNSRDATLWVLDEPLAALDVSAVDWLEALLDSHLAAGKALLITSHQPLRLGSRWDELALDPPC